MALDDHSRKKLLIISIWEKRWAMGGEAGVSDDYYFIRGFTRQGWELHFVAPEGAEESNVVFDNVVTHTYTNFFRETLHRSNAFKRLSSPPARWKSQLKSGRILSSATRTTRQERRTNVDATWASPQA